MRALQESPKKTLVHLNRSSSKVLLFAAVVTCFLFPATLMRGIAVKAAPPSHVMFLPYYTTKAGWDSILSLNNATHGPLTAGLTLYSLAGEALPLPDVSLVPDQHAALRITDLIANAQRGRRFKRGSIEVRFSGSSMDLGAQLTVSDSKHGLSFDMEPPMAFKSSTLEGLWWSPDSKTTGQIMLSNTTSASLDVLLTVGWQTTVNQAPMLPLSAHQTVVLEIQDLLKDLHIKSKGIGRGGLSIAHNGAPGSLIAHGLVQNREARFASNLNFIDPAAQMSSVLNGTGVMLARPSSPSVFPNGHFFTPVLALRNCSAMSQTAAVTVQYASAGKAFSKSIPVVDLAPRDIKMVDFSELLSSLGGSSIDDAGVKIESSGAAGSVIAQLTSMDQNGSLCVDVPLTDVGADFIGTGAHPFNLEGDSQAVVHLKNLDAKPTTAIVQVRYDNGEFSPELINLGPEQSVSVDLRQLRDSRTRDVHGHQLPGDFTNGQVQWFQHGKETVIGRLVASSPSLGLSASFACGGVCCPPSFYSFNVTPGSLDGIPEDEFDLTMTETDYTCGQFYGPFNITGYVTCTSTDESVAEAYGTTIEMEDEGVATINIEYMTSTFERTNFECDSGCEPNCVETNNPLTEALQALVRRPHHLVVVLDGTSSCDGAFERDVKYRVVDRNGNTITRPMRLKEHFISISQNTCGNGQPSPSPCSLGYVTPPSGEFFDVITTCYNPGGTCGYDLHWQWQWCPLRRAALPLATFNGYVHNDQVSINGNTTGFSPGMEIFP